MNYIKNLWEKLSNLGLTPEVDQEEQSKIRIMNQQLTMILLIVILSLPLYFVFYDKPLIILCFATMVIVLISLLFSAFQQFSLMKHYTFISAMLLFVGGIIYTEGIVNFDVFAFSLIGSVFFIFNKTKTQLLYAALVVFYILICYFLMYFFQENDEITEKLFVDLYMSLMSYGMAVVILFAFKRSYSNFIQTIIKNQNSLNQAQGLAKVGSWEYSFKEDQITWSEQMKVLFQVKNPSVDEQKTIFLKNIPSEIKTIIDNGYKENNILLDIEMDYSILLNDKEKRFRITVQSQYDKNVIIPKLFGTIQDITQQFKQAADIKHSNSLLESTIESTEDGILVVKADKSEITLYNKKFLEIWGISEETMKNDISAVAERAKRHTINFKESVAGAEKVYKNPFLKSIDTLYLRNGKVIERHNQPQIIDNKIVGIVWFYRDVTKKIKAEKAVRESEKRFRSIFENSLLGIATLDKNNVFLDINPALSQMLGYEEAELKDKTLNEITVDSETAKLATMMKLLVGNKLGGFNVEKQYYHKNGTIISTQTTINAIFDDQGSFQYSVATIMDISQRKRNEDKVKNLNEELQQSNVDLKRSNTELEQFAYVASHDLQEPLRMVGNFVQLLEEEYEENLDKEGRMYINFAVDGVKRMSKLIDDLLQYSRVGRKEMQLKATDTEEIVGLVIRDLSKRIYENNVQVTFGDLPDNVYCEPSLLSLVFQNLIYNAIKFNTKEKPKVSITAESKEGNWVFAIEDNGIGIRKENFDKIFEIFKRLHRKEEYQGTGIGLAICKRIIARHRGKIWIESEFGKGTTFYFSIPKRLDLLI